MSPEKPGSYVVQTGPLVLFFARNNQRSWFDYVEKGHNTGCNTKRYMATPYLDQVWGNEDIVSALRKYVPLKIKQLEHLLVYGSRGVGKSHMVRMFLKDYFAHHKIPAEHADEMTCWLQSCDDKGIDTVRTKIHRFSRSTSRRYPGVAMWLVIDDCDAISFPILSQQALRCTLEEDVITARFIFIGNHLETFIEPVQSRCRVYRMTPVDLMPHMSKVLAPLDNLSQKMDVAACATLVGLSMGSVRQMFLFLEAIRHIYADQATVTAADVRLACDAPPIALIRSLLRAYLTEKTADVTKHMVHLWRLGMSLPDVCDAVQTVCDAYAFFDNDALLRINALLARAHVYCIQNRTELFDMMSLFLIPEIEAA
jgi:replication factor C small subunit